MEFRIQRLHGRGVRAAAGLIGKRPLKLNLGCGQNLKAGAEGWINVDLFEPRADFPLDLRRPLPVPDSSIDLVYSEHVFEHLSFPAIHDRMGWSLETEAAPSEALQFLRESRRVLVPGGRLRVGVPDAERAVRLYLQGRFETWGPPWVDTPMHFLNYVFRQGREHLYAYDEQTLIGIVRRAGFSDVGRSEFSRAVDSEHRRNDTLYVEAVKTS
jgi:predicted SAM-dependent methyltransferase